MSRISFKTCRGGVHNDFPIMMWIRCVVGGILRYRRNSCLIRENLEKQLNYIPNKRQIRRCCRDYYWFRVKFLGSMDDFFKSQMYRKSDFVREESLSRYIRFPWRDHLQNVEDWHIFTDKRDFYNAFREYLHRDWMVVDKETLEEDYLSFLKRNNYQIFVKEPLGYGGKQVSYHDLKTEGACMELFRECRESSYVLEGRLQQCEEIHAFSDGAVNTMRIVTLIDRSGQPHVAGAVLRLGRSGASIDNYSSGGIGAHIDVNMGIVDSCGMDGDGRKYILHPDTGKQIIGYQIPDWSGYKNFACELAGKIPGMRYVGWDIIKDAEGNFCVIEGNKDAGADVLECMLMEGLLPQYEAILNEG